jgi:hypothetical protein
LVRRLIERLGSDIDVLDFSCGDNYPILEQEFDASLYACDIRSGYPYDGDTFFRFDPVSEPERTFEAILSVDALEHVSEPEPTWRYFNHVLPTGGIMAHSFPTATEYPRGHHFFRIPFHACLFSTESLNLWAERMGFSYRGSESLPDSDVGEVYWFKKERTIP